MLQPHDVVSGFITEGVKFAIHQISDHVRIAIRCRKELNSLKDLVITIEPIINQIQQYRLELNRKRGIPISAQSGIIIKPSAVNDWLKKMNSLLLKASTMAQECTIPSYDFISRYRTSRNIIRLNTQITQHLQSVSLIGLASVLEGFGHIKHSVEALAASSSSSSTTTSEPVTSTGIIINETIVVGQDSALKRLEELVTDAESNSPFSRIGVLGKGGSGKTLLMKTLFNSKKVRDLFSDGFLIWLTVSESPSISSLRKELFTQISMGRKVIDPNINLNKEAVSMPLNEALQGKRFALFLDDVWQQGGELLEELGVLRLIHLSSSKIIVSSRNSRVLLKMGVAKESTITVGDLMEEDSWQLFCYYCFPYNYENVPAGIDEETAKAAKVLCHKCGGLPLAIKAVGRAMAGITDAKEWWFAVQRLSEEKSKGEEAVYDRLRLSYDALGNERNYGIHLQLAFLYLGAAFLEDEVVQVETDAILLWMGEVVVGKNEGGHDPFEMGRIYVNVLADRYLIEPTMKDEDGRIRCFRMHDVLRGLAIQIAEAEENFYCRAGKGLTDVNENEFSLHTRIVLQSNNLSSLSESLRAPEISSLLVARNSVVTQIPKKVIGSMISLKILDLTWTSLQSLPESVGCWKELVCLKLGGVPIKRLPASFTNLAALQILYLEGSKITELPSDLHKLRSLRYLNLNQCNDLKCVPSSISSLTSLQHLYISDCESMTWKAGQKRSQKAASINSLRSLTQLKSLHLDNCGAAISDETLGSMGDMETFQLTLTRRATLPHGIFNISKLRKLMLFCPDIARMESKFYEFHNLTLLQLWKCYMLEELPDLRQLKSLKRLDIVNCTELKSFPEEFGDRGAFPLLEQLSIVELEKLEALPIIEEGGMPSLKIVTIMLCETLKIFPEYYLNIKQLQKLRVYGCSIILENLGRLEKKNEKIEMITMPTRETKDFQDQFLEVSNTLSSWLYSEFSSSELFLFLRELYHPL